MWYNIFNHKTPINLGHKLARFQLYALTIDWYHIAKPLLLFRNLIALPLVWFKQLRQKEDVSEFKKRMIFWHIFLISLFIIYASYQDYKKLHSDANDVQYKIDNTLKRFARQATGSEIKHKYFVKRQANMENAKMVGKSTKLK